MTSLASRVYGGLDRLEAHVDRWVRRGRNRLGLTGPVLPVPYLGHGRPDRVWLCGRVLEGRPMRPADPGDPWWRNAAAILRQAASREVPDVPVRLEVTGVVATTTSDADGYYQVQMDGLDLSPGWHPVQVRADADQGTATAACQVLVVPTRAPVAVVSDIDDTVVHSGITHLLVAARTVLFHNATTRVPWPGVATLYRELVAGTSVAGQTTPVYYLSTSPWNLYHLLTDFLDRHRLPAGPLFLMDWGLSPQGFLRGGKDRHKLDRIYQLLDAHPDMTLLLVGDSGERDAEVFLEVAKQHPGRVVGAVVRDVTPRTSPHARSVRAALDELRGRGVPVVLCQDTVSAAVFAQTNGWVGPAAPAAVLSAQSGGGGGGI